MQISELVTKSIAMSASLELYYGQVQYFDLLLNMAGDPILLACTLAMGPFDVYAQVLPLQAAQTLQGPDHSVDV